MQLYGTIVCQCEYEYIFLCNINVSDTKKYTNDNFLIVAIMYSFSIRHFNSQISF